MAASRIAVFDGPGRADRLGAITRTGLSMTLAVTSGLVAIGYLCSRRLMGVFTTSEPVIELARSLLHVMLWSSVVFGCAGVLAGAMRASGTVLVPMGISILLIVAVELPRPVRWRAASASRGCGWPVRSPSWRCSFCRPATTAGCGANAGSNASSDARPVRARPLESGVDDGGRTTR